MQVSFGYKSILTRLYNKGQLPEIKFDIYGKPIKKATIEHIIPKSKGGKSELANYAIADYVNNMKRSNDFILLHTTVENIKKYYLQFIGVKRPNFDGDEYIKNAIKTLKKLDIEV